MQVTSLPVTDDFDLGLDGSDSTAVPAMRFQLHGMHEMLKLPQPAYLIRDLLIEGQVACIYADPGSYKSFLALHFGVMITNGLMWQGRPIKRRRVIYCAGEGYRGFALRQLGWCVHHERADTGIETMEGGFNLYHRDDVDALIDSIKMTGDGPDAFASGLSPAARPAASDQIGLVVFDTLSSFIAGLDENSPEVMPLVVEHLKLVAKKLSCAVLIVHHCGKDKARGARGHSSLNGNVDAMWLLEKGENRNCTLKVVKQKDGEDGQKFHFMGHVVDLGIFDDEGVRRTSLAFDYVHMPVELPSPALDMAGTLIPKEQADRRSIAYMLTVGFPMPLTDLIPALKPVFNAGKDTIRKRIKAAIPIEWTSTGLLVDGVEEQVEVRFIDNGNGCTSYVECREAPSTGRITF